VFFVAEYANMILIAALAATMFLGGWLSPVPLLADMVTLPVLHGILADGFHWFAIKVAVLLLFFLWIRATFPRYRYDQIMRLGWKVFIPLTLAYLVIVAAWIQSPWNIWK